MSRSVAEWIGKSDDSRPPPRVLARIFQREGGVCHISRRKIMPGEKWQADHKIALINGGKNCESNLFPALVGPHKAKTKIDVAEKARIAAINGKHIGAIVPAGKIKSAPMPTTAKAAARVSKAPVVDRGSLFARFGQANEGR
jgi:5-methylcytosine-specific restriction endonuclease McrA